MKRLSLLWPLGVLLCLAIGAGQGERGDESSIETETIRDYTEMRIDTLWFARQEVPQPDIVQGDRAAVICTTRAVWQLRWR